MAKIDIYDWNDIDKLCKCLIKNIEGCYDVIVCVLRGGAIPGIIIANELNIPKNVIGILIVSIGTSIPELTADLTALRRRSEGIAVGDILGSNICDILLATSSGAIISEFNVPPIILLFDIPMLFIALSLAYYFLWTEKFLKKWEAAILIGFFCFYALLKVLYFQV